ncbi:MAG: MFS transporter, partial [Novosphingobium sp.]
AGFAFLLGAVGYSPETVSDTAREAIRWAYYGSAVVLLVLQTIVVLMWPMDGLDETIRSDVASRGLAAAE